MALEEVRRKGRFRQEKEGWQKEPALQVKDVLEIVFRALSEKGYNPVSQIVGYVMSGDPTYITSYKNARSLIMKAERDEIIEVLLENYIETRLK